MDATTGLIRFEVETNATFRLAGVRLAFAKDTTPAIGTTLKFTAKQGTNTWDLGNYKFRVRV